MLGYEPGEWPSGYDVWFELGPREDREAVLAADAESDRTGVPFNAEYRQRRKDGTWIWVHDEAVLIRDADGIPSFWQGIRFDITDRKTAERALAEAEERYRTLVENLPAATYVDAIDERSSTVYVSPQIEQLWGYTQAEWVADPELWIEALHPDDRARVMDSVARHNELGEPFEVEYRLRAKDGRWTWVSDHARVVRDDEGTIQFSQGVMFDVTERRVAEDQLRETEARYRALVEHIPAVLYVDPADKESESLYVSPQVADLLGVTQEEYLSDPRIWRRLIHPDDDPWVMEEYKESVRRRDGWSVEYRVNRPDGRMVWIRDESVFLAGADGQQSDHPGGPVRHHGAQAGGAGARRERAARARGRRTPTLARRDEEHVPRGRLARAPEPAHVDPRSLAHARAAGAARRGP